MRLDNIPIMGIIIPIMGISFDGNASGIASALFSPVQAKVLGLLFGQPDRRFQGAELIRLVGAGTGAVHRQLQRLAESGLVIVTRIGNQKHYQANPDAPMYAELRGLVVKSVGLAEPIRRGLAPLAGAIRAAFVFGSVAAGRETASSDIDLLVITDSLRYPDVIEALLEVERELGRPVNPILLTSAEWRVRREEGGSLVDRVMRSERIFVLGSDADLA